MAEFLYDASFFIAVAIAGAIVWQFFKGDGSSPSDHTQDILDPYDDDDSGWGNDDGDADDD